MTYEEKVEMIEKALMAKKARKGTAPHWFYELVMKKTGHRIKVEFIKHAPSHSFGRWHSGSIVLKVTGDGIKEAKFFKSSTSLAKAIACGIIN